jgi:hypothetical protein
MPPSSPSLLHNPSPLPLRSNPPLTLPGRHLLDHTVRTPLDPMPTIPALPVVRAPRVQFVRVLAAALAAVPDVCFGAVGGGAGGG